MKAIVKTFVILLWSCSVCLPQQIAAQEKEKLTGLDWVKQFEGSWATESKQPGASQAQTATLDSEIVGQFWIVNQHRGKISGMNFHAVQTIGYDENTKRFVGTWVDSFASHTWNYDGELDETCTKLTLYADGPDWTDASKTREYRDTYEFKSKDEIVGTSQMKNDEGKWETFITSKLTRTNPASAEQEQLSKPNGSKTVIPFLMFIGQAEAAMELYKNVFEDFEVENMVKYKAGETGKEGKVKLATFNIEGQAVKCIDSPPVHDFDFTPSFSFFIECEDEKQLKARFEKLSEGGKVMMPVDNYGFSKKFGWVSDKFGVSWQLNLN